MFNFFKKTPSGKTITFSIKGMHCTSCALNIDDSLEETPGVFQSKTSYPKSTTTVIFNPDLTTPQKLIQVIADTGYTAQPPSL